MFIFMYFLVIFFSKDLPFPESFAVHGAGMHSDVYELSEAQAEFTLHDWYSRERAPPQFF